ncbi:MAG: ABC transporter permease subunit [Verrucomicrobiota bacterium]
MKSLLRKEMRAQWPFFIFMVFLFLLDFGSVLLTENPDQYGLPEMINSWSAEEGQATNVIMFLIIFALGYGLLVREKDEGHLEFLDGLPCSRFQVYLAKVLVALVIVGIEPLCSLFLGWTLHLLSQTSLESGLHLKLAVVSFSLEWFMGAVYLGFALALSFFRRFAFLILGLLVVAYLILSSREVPWVRFFNPFGLTFTDFHGQDLLIPWRYLAVMALLSFTGYIIAYVGFLMQGDRLNRISGALERRRLKAPLLALATVVIGALWFGLFIALTVSDVGESLAGTEETVVYPSWKVSRAVEGDLEFVCPIRHRSSTRTKKKTGTHRL